MKSQIDREPVSHEKGNCMRVIAIAFILIGSFVFVSAADNPQAIFKNTGTPNFPGSDGNWQRIQIPPESLALVSEIQPIVTRAYRAHVDGDAKEAIKAYREYFEAMVRLWPKSQPLTIYYFHGPHPGQSSWEPLPTIRMVQYALQDIKGALLQHSIVEQTDAKATYALIQEHFADFTGNSVPVKGRGNYSFLTNDFKTVGTLLETPSVEAKTPAAIPELLAEAQTQYKDGILKFDAEKYENLTERIIAAAQIASADWKTYLYLLAAQRDLRLVGTSDSLISTQQRAGDSLEKAAVSDSKFPADDFINGARKGAPIEPVARLLLGTLLNNWHDGSGVSSRHEDAAKEFETIIKQYPDPTLEIHQEIGGNYSVLGSAFASLIRIYGKSERSDELATAFVYKYPDMPFAWGGWWVGNTHPEALQYLADRETDGSKKIGYLFRIIEEAPNVWTGKAGSDDGGTYDLAAVRELLSSADSQEEKDTFCNRILNSSKASKAVKQVAKTTLALQKLEEESASRFIKPATYDYRNVCVYKYFYDAQKISESDLKNWIMLSPRAHKWTQLYSNFLYNPDKAEASLSDVIKNSPKDLQTLLNDYRRKFNFYSEVKHRETEYLKTYKFTLLTADVGDISPHAVCPDILIEISKSTAPAQREKLVRNNWFNALNIAFQKKHSDDGERDWEDFLKGRNISELRTVCDWDD